MELTKIKSLLLLSALMLALAGCGSDDSTTDNTTEEEDVCATSTGTGVENTYLPEITFTEVDEGSAGNDSRATAETIASSNTILTGNGSYQFPGAGCVDCDDFFSLAVSEGDELEFELTTPEGMTAFIYLYEGDATTTEVYSDSGDYVKRLEHTISAGVTSLIIYINTYQGTGDYELQIKTPVDPVTIAATPPAECLANLQGALSNAVDGAVIEGATINLREGTGVKTGTVDFTTTSGAQGQYELTEVDAGDHTIEVVKEGFITHYFDIKLEGEETTEKKFQLSPTLEEGQFRIILSWGASPQVLDSQLHGPKSTSGSFHVNWRNWDGDGANLDKDASNGYGPETITITTFNPGTYTYWVNDYTNQYREGSTILASSGANVTVYDSTGIVKQYTVPSGVGTRWSVFTMTGEGVITDVNELDEFSYCPDGPCDE